MSDNKETCPECGADLYTYADIGARQQFKQMTRQDIARRYNISRSLTYKWALADKFPEPDISEPSHARWYTKTISEWEGKNRDFFAKRGINVTTLPPLEIYREVPKPLTETECKQRSKGQHTVSPQRVAAHHVGGKDCQITILRNQNAKLREAMEAIDYFLSFCEGE